MFGFKLTDRLSLSWRYVGATSNPSPSGDGWSDRDRNTLGSSVNLIITGCETQASLPYT